ncbi:hypothetical protein DSM112329_04972 [Paraconexibacter sp. AEG42_29]|uniref:Spermidine synthase n=1 Tax=Paraconexibacter sp. AEG42_29 TaxID=2997339 RepID=A0AAU7B2G8_9ACTN
MSRRRTPDPVVARAGGLTVLRDPLRPTGRLLLQDDMDASYIDLADAQHLEFDYLRWARIVLQSAGARRVLHVGGAACALARALVASDPDGRHEVVEVDPAVLDIAREHLGLRRMPGLRVRVGDGRERVAARADGSVDAIVLDAFVGARVPAHLVTVEALADAARVAPLTVVNIVDTRTLDATWSIAAALQMAYPSVAALGARGLRGGNVVLIGSADPLPWDRITARAAADRSPARLVAPADVARQTLGRIPRHDPDGEPSAGAAPDVPPRAT